MLFSIIIPTYNRAELVKRTLNSVLQQEYRPIQLILVDNNSSDLTLESLQQFKKDNESNDFIIEVTTEYRCGATYARNTGAKLAKGEWILFFDSDDVMLPNLTSTYADAIKSAPEDTKLIYTKAKNIRIDGSIVVCPFYKKDLIINHLLHSIFSTQRYAIKRDAYNNIGEWNETITRWVDWELGTRIALRYAENAIPVDVEPLVYIYSQTESITGTSFTQQHSTLERALDLVEEDILNSGHPDKDHLVLYVEHRRIVLAAHYQREGHTELAQKLYHETYNRCKHIWRLRFIFPYIFWHVSKGYIGSATIIKAILR